MAYAAIMLTAIGAAAWLNRRAQRPLPLSGRERLAVGLGAFVGGMLGAKLPFVLLDPAGLASGLAWFDNGKTIVFGLVGGYLGVELAKAMAGITVRTGDSFAVPVAAAVAIGRWSCVVGGCCYGKATALPWGVDFGDGLRRHPTQVYESIFHATMAVTLAWLGRRGRFPGQLFKLYILAYLAYRFATEFLRPEPVVGLGLTAYQWAALGLAPVFVLLWRRDARPAATRTTNGGVGA